MAYLCPPIFATKMLLLAAVFLLIPTSVGLVSYKKAAWNFQFFPANRKQGPAVLTNNKQENVGRPSTGG
jgi:hypothetical protein